MGLVKIILILLAVLSITYLICLSKRKKIKDSMLDLSQLQGTTTNLSFVSTPFPSSKPPVLHSCIGRQQCV